MITSTYAQNGFHFMEQLDRGLVAVPAGDSVLVSWRWLASDTEQTLFELYRNETKIKDVPPNTATNLKDVYVPNARYHLITKHPERKTARSKSIAIWEQEYLRIPLQRPEGTAGYTYSPNDASVADLDNDGEYEILLKWNPSNAKDNSQAGITGHAFLDAYEMDGTKLWRIDLGKNIRAGAHYTQFIAYDFESDGYAEVVCKTADGTIDGLGSMIGDAEADYRNEKGYVLEGPEYLTVFDGLTGEARATTDYLPARGEVSSWGDGYGNRVDRFLAGVAYLDGERPSILMTRGYYTRTVIAAWDYRGGQLAHRWTFDTNQEGNGSYAGRGNHSLSTADLDADGRDEVIFGGMAVDDDGTPFHKTTWGHGDALHVSDFDPSREGLEIVMPVEWASENPSNQRPGLTFRDGQTGELIWGAYPAGEDVDVGRGACADITASSPGAESWASNGLGLYSAKGERIGALPSSVNFVIWWDGDLTRELLNSNTIEKYGAGTLLEAIGTTSNNGTKSTPALSADLFGDWREELILREENNEYLRIYTTPIPTQHKLVTLMHDRQYREAIAWQNVGYNQPPHTSYFIGHHMKKPPQPLVKYPKNK